METGHCQKEGELLNLLKELRTILGMALNSLGGKKPPTAEASYLGYAAKSGPAADGYASFGNPVALTHQSY